MYYYYYYFMYIIIFIIFHDMICMYDDTNDYFHSSSIN